MNRERFIKMLAYYVRLAPNNEIGSIRVGSQYAHLKPVLPGPGNAMVSKMVLQYLAMQCPRLFEMDQDPPGTKWYEKTWHLKPLNDVQNILNLSYDDTARFAALCMHWTLKGYPSAIINFLESDQAFSVSLDHEELLSLLA